MAVNDFPRSHDEYASVLGVVDGMSRRQVRKNYIAEIGKVHPDQQNQADLTKEEEARINEKSARINEAWNYFDKKHFGEDGNTTAKSPSSSGTGPTGSDRTNTANGNGSTSSNSNSNSNSNTSGGTSNNNTRRGHTNSNTGSQRTSPTGSNRTNATNGSADGNSGDTTGNTSNSRRNMGRNYHARQNTTNRTAPPSESHPATKKTKKTFKQKVIYTLFCIAGVAYVAHRFVAPYVHTAEDKVIDKESNAAVHKTMDSSVKLKSLGKLESHLSKIFNGLTAANLDGYATTYNESPFKGVDENKLQNIDGKMPYFTHEDGDISVTYDGVSTNSYGTVKPDKRTLNTTVDYYFSIIPRKLPSAEILEKAGIKIEGAKAYTLRGATVGSNHDFTPSTNNQGARWSGNPNDGQKNRMEHNASCYNLGVVEHIVVIDKLGNKYGFDSQMKPLDVRQNTQSIKEKTNSAKTPNYSKLKGQQIQDKTTPRANKWANEGISQFKI